MLKIEEHKTRMALIKQQADKAKGKQRLQLLKCYHRMQKELKECQSYIRMG